MKKVYLTQIPRTQALQLFLERAALPRKEENLAVAECLGRVTARPVMAQSSLPGYHAAAMDGIAVKAWSTFGASDQQPLVLKNGDYQFVNTGDPIPEGFDAVIKVEDLQELPERRLEITSPASPWQNIRPVGEDIVAREMILPAFHRLEPVDLGALLAGGITVAPVLARPKAAIIPTGDELVKPGEAVNRGKLPEFNSTVISGYLTQWGAETKVFPVTPDKPEELSSAVKAALPQADMVIIIAGSSKGTKDYTSTAIGMLGEILVHGVATRPGKPTILGIIDHKPIVGIPGYPVSAYLALEWFVRPLLYRYWGLPEPERATISAVLGRRIVSEPGVEEFIRVAVGFINGRFIANPLGRGAGLTMSLVKADGLLVIPANSLGCEEGTMAEIQLYRTERELKNSVVVMGSHDPALDLLGEELREISPGLKLSSSHVGSMGGITAVWKGLAHLAGVHLLDTATGEYNIPFIKRLLGDEPLVLVNLAYRIQGWMVPPGNPCKIQTVTDLLQKDLRFINRQRGAGTRMLLDFLLAKGGIKGDQIYGYQREEYSHLNVAAAIAAGTADVGLGIYSAAQSFGLDFIPVGEERYDLLMLKDFYDSSLGKAVIQAITSRQFQEKVETLGGYSLRHTGRVIYEQ